MSIEKAKVLAQALVNCFGSVKEAHLGYQRVMQNNCSLHQFEQLLK